MMNQSTSPPPLQVAGVLIQQFIYKVSGALNLPPVSGDQVSVVVAGTNFMARHMEGSFSDGILRPGDVTIVPRGLASRWVPQVEEPSRVLHLTFAAEAWSLLSAGLGDQPDQIRFKDDFANPDPLLMQLAVALLNTQNAQSKQIKLYSESLAMTLKLHMLQNYTTSAAVYDGLNKSASGGFRHTRDYIRGHLSEDLSLATLAGREGLSVYHFARTFREQTGFSPRQFIINERVNRAKQLLKSNLPLAEIARQVGFANQSHFTRSFKRIVGQTPNQFRKS